MANENVRVLILRENYNEAMNSSPNNAWLSLGTNGAKIVDVTPTINKESRNKISRGRAVEEWHALPKERNPQYNNIDESQKKILLNSSFNKKTPNATCSGCQHLYAREKKLRARLKMTEAFIHTINHRLEIDTALISEKINDRARLMEQLEENNLRLHQQKHEAHSKLMQVEKNLHDVRIENKHLQSENDTLKEQLNSLKALIDIKLGESATEDLHFTKEALISANRENRNAVDIHGHTENQNDAGAIPYRFLVKASCTPTDTFQTKRRLFCEDGNRKKTISKKDEVVEHGCTTVKPTVSTHTNTTDFSSRCTQTDKEHLTRLQPVDTSTPVKKELDFAKSKPTEKQHLVRPDTPNTTSRINSNSTDQIECDFDDDECYIMKLKDQASAVRHQLMNIQSLLGDINGPPNTLI